MTIERMHNDHKLLLGVIIKPTEPTDKEINLLATDLYNCIHDLPINQVGGSLSWKAIWIQVMLNGVEFNARDLNNPDIFFNYTISKREVRIHSNVMFTTIDKQYHAEHLMLEASDYAPTDEQASVEQAMCKVVAKTLLNTVRFLRSI